MLLESCEKERQRTGEAQWIYRCAFREVGERERAKERERERESERAKEREGDDIWFAFSGIRERQRDRER